MAHIFGATASPTGKTGGMGYYDATNAKFVDEDPTGVNTPLFINNWVPFAYADATDFAKKVDISVAGVMMDCGECHVGGGAMEFVPLGNGIPSSARVSLRDIADPATDVNGFGPIEASDYTAFNYFKDTYDVDGDGNLVETQYIDYQKTGVMEVDCLMCHLKGYKYEARNEVLREGKIDATRTVGAGIGAANTLTWGTGNGTDIPAGYGTTVDYDLNIITTTSRTFTYPGDAVATTVSDWRQIPSTYFEGTLLGKPDASNCASCHAATAKLDESGNPLLNADGDMEMLAQVDWKKRGDAWIEDGKYEVHYFMGCMGCHERTDNYDWSVAQSNPNQIVVDPVTGAKTYNLGHDPAKGDAPFSSLFNDNDNVAFKSCVDCHINGTTNSYGAPDPTAAHQAAGLTATLVQSGTTGVATKSHLDIMTCEACHVLKLSDRTDFANDGAAMVDATGPDAEGRMADHDNQYVRRNAGTLALSWYKGKLLKTAYLTTIFWRDKNDDIGADAAGNPLVTADANFDGRTLGMDALLMTDVLQRKINQSPGSTYEFGLTHDGVITETEVGAHISQLTDVLASKVATQPTNGWKVKLSIMGVPFKVNHGVSPKQYAYGSVNNGNGCADCHSSAVDVNGYPVADFYQGNYEFKGDDLTVSWNSATQVAPLTKANGFAEATDFHPNLKTKDAKRTIARRIMDGNTLHGLDRSALIYEDTFKTYNTAWYGNGSPMTSAAAINFANPAGPEATWLFKIEERAVGSTTSTMRTRKISKDLADVAGMITDLSTYASAFGFTITDNGAGGITIEAKTGYEIRLGAQMDCGPLGLGGFQYALAPITPVLPAVATAAGVGATIDGRVEMLAYLNAITASDAGIFSGPSASIATIDGTSASAPVDVTLGQSVALVAAGQVGPGTANYYWYINDGLGVNGTTGSPSEVFTGQTINHTFSKKGTWTVTLKVIDEEGNVAQTFQKVNAAPAASDIAVAPSYNSETGVTTLTISGLPVDTDTLYMLYGDGSKEKVEGVTLSGVLNDTATVTHIFNDNYQFEVDPGVFTYKVSVYAFDAGVRLEANGQEITIDTNPTP